MRGNRRRPGLANTLCMQVDICQGAQAFDHALRRSYAEAVREQEKAQRDLMMIDMGGHYPKNADLVSAWMCEYSLFQGIQNVHRRRIVDCYLRFRNDHPVQKRVTRKNIESLYQELLTALHKTHPRGWMSATSKLLWCMHPHDVVILDSFVHRSLVVLQYLHGGLSKMPRIGGIPSFSRGADAASATRWYLQYQDMVKTLAHEAKPSLDQLRVQHACRYPYDIRIIDKVLWMMGAPERPLPSRTTGA